MARYASSSQVSYVGVKYIGLLFTILLVGLEISALNHDTHYRYDILMCLILLAGVYYLKEIFSLHWLHYFMFAVFILVHCLGLYGYYDLFPLGLEYDYWVHGYFGLVSCLMLMRGISNSRFQFSWAIRVICSLIIVLGISSAHELYEFAGAVILGEGDGVLFIGAGDLDPWDTQKDMLNNLLGAIVGIVLIALTRLVSFLAIK